MADYGGFFEKHLKGSKWRRDGEGSRKCPFHEDRKASLSVNRHSGLWFCHACNLGGTARDFADRLGVEAPTDNLRSAERVYDYRDEKGALLYQVVRLAGKEFRQRRPDGKGGWIWKLDDVRRVPYRLPELLGSHGNVFIVEGEKDVETLRSQGLTATCNSGGAEKWRDEYGEALKGRVCILIADNDKAGRNHVEDVARKLAPYAEKIINLGVLPNSREHGDVSEWLAAGNTPSHLLTLVATAEGSAHAPDGAGPALVEDDDWPTPETLTDALLPVKSLTPEMLPAVLRDWLCDIAERYQGPLEYVTIPAIVAAGALIGRKLAIRPERHGDWSEVPNLWGVIVGRPGVMKSPLMAEALKPISRLDHAAYSEYQDSKPDIDFKRKYAAMRRETIEAEMRKHARDDKKSDELRREWVAADYREPIARRYVVNDATVEKLGELLNQNPVGLLCVRDELGALLARLDSEDHASERGFFLTAWAGKQGYNYDRIGRGTLRIEAACLSVMGAVTPSRIDGYMRETFGGGNDDGLMQRFGLTVYPDLSAPWKHVDREPNREAFERAHDAYKWLDCMKPDQVDANSPDFDLPYLRLSDEALRLFEPWREQLENQIRTSDEHPALLSHLSKYRTLVPALVLIFRALDLAPGADHGMGWESATRRALAWCDVLESHARRIYQGVTTPAETAAALIAAKLRKDELPNPFRTRDIYRRHWAGLSKREDIEAALSVLEDVWWVRREDRTPGKIGRPSTLFHVNPKNPK